MNDETRLALDDTETPVNPYSLLAAVNASGRSAGVAWLIFLGLMAYLLIAIASVTHRDLLLAGDITLPLLQVKIGLIRFFLLVPILFVLLHVGLLGKLALLARKTLEFDAAVRLLESTDQRSHPLRLELDNFFLVQVFAGPDRSRVVSAFLNGLSWLTLVIFPLALLLYVQVAFLPFHDGAVTLVHRLAVVADVVLLLLMGVFLMRADVTYFGAVWRTAVSNPGSLAFGAVVLLAATFVAAVATVPGETHRDSHLGFLIGSDGALFGVFPRNLHVTDAALAVGRDIASDGRSVNLRGRDLRLARLDRVGLQRADLTGANLDGASLAGADLRHIRLACEERTDLRPSENRQSAPCASARGANFTKARMSEVRMAGIDLRGARLEEARLDGADMAHGLMSGANFASARLERADVTGGAALQGTNFLLASLQGADLSGAKLQMADFANASLQGANLSLANLEGAVLRDHDYEVKPLLTTIFSSRDFYSQASYGGHVKGPVEHYVAMLKHLGADSVPNLPSGALELAASRDGGVAAGLNGSPRGLDQILDHRRQQRLALLPCRERRIAEAARGAVVGGGRIVGRQGSGTWTARPLGRSLGATDVDEVGRDHQHARGLELVGVAAEALAGEAARGRGVA